MSIFKLVRKDGHDYVDLSWKVAKEVIEIEAGLKDREIQQKLIEMGWTPPMDNSKKDNTYTDIKSDGGMDCGYMDMHNMLFDAFELEAMKGVTRFEVIDDTGRAYVKYLKDDERVKFGLQDDDRTLKVFIDSHSWKEDL